VYFIHYAQKFTLFAVYIVLLNVARHIALLLT